MKTKPFFITDLDYKLLQKKYKGSEFDKIIEKINNNYPVQYAIGDVEFYGTTINVDERVLIPRFETELLVDKIIDIFKDRKSLNILDLCTGSGCIAISLAKNLNCQVDAVDISKEALSLAKENAKLNNTKISFSQKDILKDYDFDKKYDLIVSNPPYVKRDEIVTENTKYEPSIALYPKTEDIIFYKKIISFSKNIIKKNGLIAFEIGSTQGARIKKIALDAYPNATVEISKDYNNFDRYLFIRMNN